MNLVEIVEGSARAYPDRLALRFEDQRLTYAELDQTCSRAANGLERVGLQRGDRAAIWLPNSVAFVVAYLGVQKVGAVAVTVNTAFKAEELQHILADSGARLLITTAALYAGLGGAALAQVEQVLLVDGEQEGLLAFAALLEHSSSVYGCAEMAPDDPAILLYTSGTTGFPKGAVLSHGAAVTAVQMVVDGLGLCVEDRVLLPLSLFHSFGQAAAFLPTLAVGATLFLLSHFEPQPVLAAIEEQAVTVFFGVPTVYLVLLGQAVPARLRSVRRWLSAGAALPLAVASEWQARCGLPIQEGYGLTEIFLATFNSEPLAKPGSVGRPLAGVCLQIVDAAGDAAGEAAGEAVSAGQLGEVVVQTPSCMLGYWQRPHESAAVLRGGSFHTGDVGWLDEDGYLYIVDRIKDMINVGGVKVYPSEVEQRLYQHPAVAEAAVFGVPEPVLGEQVQASVVLKAEAAVDAQELIFFCGQGLAEFKVPSQIHIVDRLPKNRTGKLLKRLLRDQYMQEGQSAEGGLRNALPAAVVQKADGEKGDGAVLARWMATWLADRLQVAVEEIGMEQPFAEMGLTSVMAVNLAHALGAWLGCSLQAILLWNFPTIAAVVRHLLTEGQSVGAVSGQAGSAHRLPASSSGSADSVALIGIGCRLPGGADTPEKFWQLLRAGVDTVAEIPAVRWEVDAYYDPRPQVAGKMYVRAGSFLEEVDRFDAQFFGIAPLEAASMDPQQRLLLEVSWEALEHANVLADSLRESRTGVYVGAFWDDYSAEHLYNAAPDQIDSYRLLSHLRGMTAGRLAYVLGLQGPAMQVDTACSSSLLAVHLACQSLRVGECDLALAGGVSLLLGPEQLVGLCQMGAVSADGRCKTFAAGADGFGVGEGAGMVVLKRLADAERDGDRVLAVIRGSAVNHDGASNGLTAPNGRAQEAMLRQALEDAHLQPAQIQYVETHGTGTVLGDPIEVQALLQVLGAGRTQPLWLGSVKSNIGHLSAAAGIAALIKVVLSLQAGEIPPNLHFDRPNPHIPWERALLAVPVVPVEWPPAERRLAGVSSFGLTGTNVHLIVEAPPVFELPVRDEPRPCQLLTLSARSEEALAAQIERMEQVLELPPAHQSSQSWLADLCYTAATRRTHWNYRLGVVAADLDGMRARLRQARDGGEVPGVVRSRRGETPPRVAFLFAGQGPQYAGMGHQLYTTEPLFRQILQQCDAFLRGWLERPLLEVLYGLDPAVSDSLLNAATYAQPALFAVEYALASLWRSWGIEPAAVLGHSLGEYAAACVAGVFSLEDGLKLVATRGRLMQEVAPQGQMVAVLGGEADVRRVLAPYARSVALAAINTPQNLVIAGDISAIQDSVCALQQAGIATRPLKIYVASHSPLMEPILDELMAVAKTVRYRRPQLPVVSNVTGHLAEERLATPAYWRQHLREPVQFARGMETLAGLGIDVLVESGPKATLLGLGEQCLPADPGRLWLRSIQPKQEEWQQMLESLALLHGRGAAVDWHGFDRAGGRVPVTLPRYPFQRQRYWLDDTRHSAAKPAAKPAVEPVSTELVAGGHPLLGRQVASVLAARSREILFESRIDLAVLPYLADHTLVEQKILPGAGYWEMVLAAAGELGLPAVLAECTLQQGLFFPFWEGMEGAAVTVQLVLTPAADGYQWQVYSLAAGSTGEWTLHATGRLLAQRAAAGPEWVDRAALGVRCAAAVDLTWLDRKFEKQGIVYGPQFQALTALFMGDDEALGEIVLPEPVQADAGRYRLHPVLLDAALRMSSSLLSGEESEPYLPFSLERLVFYGQGGQTRLWSHVQRRAGASGSHSVDLTLFDDAGQVVAQLVDLTLRRASRQLLLGQQRRLDWLYTLAWKPASRSGHSRWVSEPGHWWILADRQGQGEALAAHLEAQGERCLLRVRPVGGADPEWFRQLLVGQPDKLRGVVFLWGLDLQERDLLAVPAAAIQLSVEALQLVQVLLQSGQAPRLWWVTRQAAGPDATEVGQAPLWGIGRTLHWEQPELACTCVDLSGQESAQALFEEIWLADGENQVLLRGGERRVARLVRHSEPVKPLPLLDPQASYLVTGGLGGLGLQVARWLADRGARQLVLAGRRGGATAEARRAIQALEEVGVRVAVVQADLGQPVEVERLLAACQAVAPLRGVVHAAGVIDDGLLLQQTPERVERVMAAKVVGSWQLHLQTLALPLEFFVCFSSIASLLGNQGQSTYAAANAFMDVLAHRRRRAGQPATAINWGGWSEVGLAAELVRSTAAAGMGAIAPAQGLELLGILMAHQAPQVGVLPIQWRRLEQTLTHPLPVLSELLGQGMQQGTSLRQQLDQLRGEERDLRVKAHVQELALKLLGTVPGDDENFLAFGLDSLMSIQLANRLSMSLGIALPSTLAFTYETLGRLVHYLIERLADGVPAEKSRSMLSSAAPLTDWVPQLYNQRECYLWHEAAANKACLHIPQCVYIHSPVESRRLERALQALVERHMALRTVYMRQGGDLLQRTLPAQRVDFAAVVLEEQPWSSVVEAILADARAPFDLMQGPVLRGRLYSRTDDDHLFLLVVHHIAADATALSVLVGELWKIYGALGEGGEPVLPAIRADWADFVRWQDALLQGAEGERLWRYWQHQLRGELPQLALPTDLPRPVQDSHAGRPYVFALEEKLTESLRQLAQRENCTLYMVLMAGFQLWLHGYTLQRDLLVAAHVANRNDLMFADVVGYLADTFPIRAQIPAGATFQSVLHQVQQTILAAMEHQGLPMRLLAERLGVAVEPSQTVLCQVWFTLLPLRLFQENGELFQVGAGSIERGGLVLEAADLLPAWLGAWYDLEMILTEGESVVFGTLVYKTDLFVESTVRQMIAEYCALLERIVAEPGRAVAELAVVAV